MSIVCTTCTWGTSKREPDGSSFPDALGRKYPNAVQRAVHIAVRAAGIHKPATCHTFRHSFATHLLECTTMIYTHVLNRGPGAVRSPADGLTAVGNEPELVRSIGLLPRYPADARRLSPPQRSGGK